MAPLKRVSPKTVCEKHHPVDYADEFANVRRRLRVLRLALGGGQILLDEVGMEHAHDEDIQDARAVVELAEEIEQRMDGFLAERERCAVCSSGAA